jgi:hypothetical protein
VNHRGWSVAAVLAASATANADCPTTPDDAVCRPWSAVLMPTVFGAFYAPHRLGSTWAGAGVEAILLAWSDSSPAFGPSHGKIRGDIAWLGGDMSASMVMYRGGAQVSFERNPSRRWLIPYFAVDVGQLWTDATGFRGFVDGGVGAYVVHRRGVIVDLEVVGLLPFHDPATLGGVKTRLAASFALW